MIRFVVPKKQVAAGLCLCVVAGSVGCSDSNTSAATTGGAAADAVKRDPKTGKQAGGRPTIAMGKSGE